MAWILPAITAATGVASALWNRKSQKETNAAMQNNWREQAEYNTPANQMTRLRDAGLNPNLAYGQIADSKMASGPNLNAPEYNNEIDIAKHQQVINMQEANALTRAQKAKVEAETTSIKHENSIFSGTTASKRDKFGLRYLDKAGKGIGNLLGNAKIWLDRVLAEQNRMRKIQLQNERR